MEPQPTNPTQHKLVWIIIVVLLLIVDGVAGFFLGKATTKPVAAPVQTEIKNTEWETYVDPSNTFLFRYPQTVSLNGDNKSDDGLNLYVQTKDLENYSDEPMGYDLETALTDKKSLKNNQTGYLFGGVPESAKLVTFSGVNGKTFMTLRLLEVCDVRFDRSLVIYKNNQQILLGLSVSNSSALAKKIPQYFTNDTNNCGDTPVWKSDSTLVTDLITHKAPKPVQDWYDTFDQILSTFKFTN